MKIILSIACLALPAVEALNLVLMSKSNPDSSWKVCGRHFRCDEKGRRGGGG